MAKSVYDTGLRGDRVEKSHHIRLVIVCNLKLFNCKLMSTLIGSWRGGGDHKLFSEGARRPLSALEAENSRRAHPQIRIAKVFAGLRYFAIASFLLLAMNLASLLNCSLCSSSVKPG